MGKEVIDTSCPYQAPIEMLLTSEQQSSSKVWRFNNKHTPIMIIPQIPYSQNNDGVEALY
jgi:hypothetical protein